MRADDWSKVSSFARSQWLPYNFCNRVVSGLPSAGQARVTVGRNKFAPLTAVPEAPLLQPIPSWIDVRCEAAAYFNRVKGTPLPDSFFQPSPFFLQLSMLHLLFHAND